MYRLTWWPWDVSTGREYLTVTNINLVTLGCTGRKYQTVTDRMNQRGQGGEKQALAPCSLKTGGCRQVILVILDTLVWGDPTVALDPFWLLSSLSSIGRSHSFHFDYYAAIMCQVGRQHQGMDRPGVWQVLEGSGEHGKMEKTGCKIICGAPATLAVKGLMMMIMCHVCVSMPLAGRPYRKANMGS